MLTAAHCIDPVDGVRIGKHNLYQEEADTEEFEILEVILHPDYMTVFPPRYDVALLILDGASKYDAVALDDGVSYPLSSGDDVGIIGWGRMQSGSKSNVLMHAEINYLTNQECLSYEGRVKDDMLCVYTVDSGASACSGDSGGPAFIENAGDQMSSFVQIGMCTFCISDGNIQ